MSKRFVVALVLLIVVAIRISAQSHLAVVRGVVVDPSGKAVPEAMLRVVNEATGESRTARSGEADGRFAISALQPGLYRVEVDKQGFTKRSVRIELQVNEERSLDLSLALQAVSVEFDITTLKEPVERESGALGTVIESRQIAGLP